MKKGRTEGAKSGLETKNRKGEKMWQARKGGERERKRKNVSLLN